MEFVSLWHFLHYFSAKAELQLRSKCYEIDRKKNVEIWNLKLHLTLISARFYKTLVFNIVTAYSSLWLIKASNMADHSLVSTGFSSKSCCRGHELPGSGVKALSSCPPGLFITFWHLVRHKTSACLDSGILNEYTTELTKQLE